MKDIIPFKDLMYESILVHYDDIIKLGYSKNYELLKYMIKAKVADENLRKFESEFGRVSLPKFIKKEMSDIYHKEANSSRIKFFTYVVDILNSNFYEVQNSYKTEANKFLKIFNDYYNTNKNIDECFDGLEILDKAFLSDLARYEREDMNNDEKVRFENLWQEYLIYQSETRLMFNFVSMCDIYNSLISDYNERGYKSINYGIAKGDVAVITKEEIQELRKLANENYLSHDKAMRNQSEVVKQATKLARKNPKDKAINAELDKQIDILTELYNKSNDFVQFENLVNIFEERLDFANFEYDIEPRTKFSNKLRWSLENKFSRKLKKPVDKVYYHRAEATILEFDSRTLDINGEIIDKLLNRAGGEFSLKNSNYLKEESLNQPLEDDSVAEKGQ